MPKRAEQTLTPRLRFPEFIGQTLREVQLKDVTAESTTRNGDKLPITSVMGVRKAEGIVPMEERIIASDIARYKIVQKEWFAYNPMRLNIGSIAQWKGENDILVSPDYIVFKCLTDADSGIDPSYLNHFRQSAAWENVVTEGGDGSVRVRIYYKDLARLYLALPPFIEQQKLADCLTSLDEVIAAQGRKVAALKAHKRGLMQQLFPREGETRPRLRFPEFRDAPEWGQAPLRELFETSSGGTPDRGNKEYWSGSIPWVTTSLVDFNVITAADEFISEAGLQNSSAKIFPKGTVIVAMYGQGKTRGQVALLQVEAATNQACAAILPNNDIDPQFVFLSLCGRYQELRALSNSGGQENLSQGLIRELPFRYPTDQAEQSKIVACLSSLDTQLTAESNQLAALKTHKQGLMQQLFPAPEAAGA